MQVKLRRERRENLKTNRIRRHGRKMRIPHEPQHTLALLDARMLRHRLLAVCRALRRAHPGPGLRQPDAQEEDIALLEGDVAFAGYLVYLVQRDGLPREGVDADAPFPGVGDVVDQYAASGNALLGPEADADVRRLGIFDFLRGGAAVEDAALGILGRGSGCIVVSKSVPLR